MEQYPCRGQLNELLPDVLWLTTQVNQVVAQAAAALQARERELAQRRLADIAAIDQAQYALKAEALNLMARQAPMARDPRLITTILVVAGELNRIREHVETIAETAMVPASSADVSADLLRMAELAQQMVHMAAQVYDQPDAETVWQGARADNTVDDLMLQLNVAS